MAAVQAFVVGKPAAAAAAAAAQGSSLSAPDDARGAAGAAGDVGGSKVRGASPGADAPPAASPNGPCTGAGLDVGPASNPDLSQAQARRAPLAAQRTEPVRRLVVCSLGGPEWRLRAAPGDGYRDGAGLGAGRGGAGGSAGQQAAAARSDGGMPGPDPGVDPDCAGGPCARAGTEVLRSAFRIKGALRGARCAGVLSFPGGAPPGPRLTLNLTYPMAAPACSASRAARLPGPAAPPGGICRRHVGDRPALRVGRRACLRCQAVREAAFVPQSRPCAVQGCTRRAWRCGWRTCATRWWRWRRCATTPASPASRPTPPGAAPLVAPGRRARILGCWALAAVWSWPRPPQQARPSGMVVLRPRQRARPPACQVPSRMQGTGDPPAVLPGPTWTGVSTAALPVPTRERRAARAQLLRAAARAQAAGPGRGRAAGARRGHAAAAPPPHAAGDRGAGGGPGRRGGGGRGRGRAAGGRRAVRRRPAGRWRRAGLLGLGPQGGGARGRSRARRRRRAAAGSAMPGLEQAPCSYGGMHGPRTLGCRPCQSCWGCMCKAVL